MKRILVVCPGRGSYDRGSLGYLRDRPAAAALLDAAPRLADLDGAASFQSKLHIAGENASILTAACSLTDLYSLDREQYAVVGVIGNSMGWYSALGAAGALSLPDTVRLVETMGAYQANNVVGGQVIWPGDAAIVDAALAEIPNAWWSIRLGSAAVLGADEAGVGRLLASLPAIERGGRAFPMRLPLHSAFHTPLMAETSQRAQTDLADLAFRSPDVPLVDGTGRIFRPRWGSPRDLRDWTLGGQVVDTYDFALSLRVALSHTAPDLVVALGPGNSLGGPISAVLRAGGWGAELLAFGVPEQRARLLS